MKVSAICLIQKRDSNLVGMESILRLSILSYEHESCGRELSSSGGTVPVQHRTHVPPTARVVIHCDATRVPRNGGESGAM